MSDEAHSSILLRPDEPFDSVATVDVSPTNLPRTPKSANRRSPQTAPEAGAMSQLLRSGEPQIVSRVGPGSAPSKRVFELISEIPERFEFRWLIKNFESFRLAARTSELPPLRSPEAEGLGVALLIWPYGRKGHVRGELLFPEHLTRREASYCIQVDTVHPETSAVLATRRFTVQVRRTEPFPVERTKFRLSRRLGRRYRHLIVHDRLCIRCSIDVYPFAATQFTGLVASGGHEGHGDLLREIVDFCTEHAARETVILQCGLEEVRGCRFLMACRSTRWRQQLTATLSRSEGSKPAPSSLGRLEPAAEWGLLRVNDLDVEMLTELIDFVHSDHCRMLDSPNDDDLIALFNAARNYGIAKLVGKVLRELSARVKSSTVFRFYELAKQHLPVAQGLHHACRELMDGLPGSEVAEMINVYGSNGGTLNESRIDSAV